MFEKECHNARNLNNRLHFQASSLVEIWHFLDIFLEIHPFAKLSSMPKVFQRVASDIIVCVERLNYSFQIGLLCPIPSPEFSCCKLTLRGHFNLNVCSVEVLIGQVFLLSLAFAFLKQAGCVIWCILNAADFTFCLF